MTQIYVIFSNNVIIRHFIYIGSHIGFSQDLIQLNAMENCHMQTKDSFAKVINKSLYYHYIFLSLH